MFPISRLRLVAQQIESSRFTHPTELVRYMGALQAQDFGMSHWAVACRVPGSTAATVRAAYDKGDILRTHVLRPTWHLVSATDIRWMLELTAPHIKAGMKSRNRQLELTPAVFAKSHKLLEEALGRAGALTRDELLREYAARHIPTHDNRASHLLAEAELDGLVCSGPLRGKTTTYALLAERAPQANTLPREEALGTLALRYFMSHGPATRADFAWWSGLPAKDVRQAIESAQGSLHRETVDGTDYYMAPGLTAPDKTGVHLLPAFDEFIIAYKNRSAALLAEHHSRAVSTNGLFRPVLLVNGRVQGLWKPVADKKCTVIETEPFVELPKSANRQLAQKEQEYLKAMILAT